MCTPLVWLTHSAPHLLAFVRRWGWALQVTFLVITAICYATTNVHNYKSALWSLAATAVVLAMFQANDLVDLYEKTKVCGALVVWLHPLGWIWFVAHSRKCIKR